MHHLGHHDHPGCINKVIESSCCGGVRGDFGPFSGPKRLFPSPPLSVLSQVFAPLSFQTKTSTQAGKEAKSQKLTHSFMVWSELQSRGERALVETH